MAARVGDQHPALTEKRPEHGPPTLEFVMMDQHGRLLQAE
jgi:hypothetical protein